MVMATCGIMSEWTSLGQYNTETNMSSSRTPTLTADDLLLPYRFNLASNLFIIMKTLHNN